MEKTAYEYWQLAQRQKELARVDLEQAKKFERLALEAVLREQILADDLDSGDQEVECEICGERFVSDDLHRQSFGSLNVCSLICHGLHR